MSEAIVASEAVAFEASVKSEAAVVFEAVVASEAVVVSTAVVDSEAVVKDTSTAAVAAEGGVGWNKLGLLLKMLSLTLLARLSEVGAEVEVVLGFSSRLGILMSGNLVSGLKNGGREPRRVVVVSGSD